MLATRSAHAHTLARRPCFSVLVIHAIVTPARRYTLRRLDGTPHALPLRRVWLRVQGIVSTELFTRTLMLLTPKHEFTARYKGLRARRVRYYTVRAACLRSSCSRGCVHMAQYARLHTETLETTSDRMIMHKQTVSKL